MSIRQLNIQEQKLEQQQLQRLSQQQMLTVKLIAMPLAELEQNIRMEIDDNPALEPERTEDTENLEYSDSQTASANDADTDIYDDDQLSSAGESFSYKDSADYEEMVYGSAKSFYDDLYEQMQVIELSPVQEETLRYLIGSLDSDGLLRKDTETIADELAIYHYLDVEKKDVDDCLHILQTFDPAGIGAQSLQECLLLQIERMENSRQKQLMHSIVSNYFEQFTKKHWNRIQASLKLSDTETEEVIREIRRLNPKPGASMGETMGRSSDQITPDFIVYTTEDGRVSFELNNGGIPKLTISDSFEEMLSSYKDINPDSVSRKEKDAMLYLKDKVEKANWFIDAVKQRQQTMQLTMRAIIAWQKKFFLDGEESDLKPMILKDIAEKTGLEISTISRVSNQKYVQTEWGIFPLKYFFSDGYESKDGEELSKQKIKSALKSLIESEDKKAPFSDEQLTRLMAEKGFPIARRTVAKYREAMGIPVARLRK